MTTPELQYAQPLRWHTTHRFQRRLILTILLLACTFSLYWWGPTLWRRYHIIRAEQRAANYTAPPDQVVYEEDPVASRQLLTRGGGYKPPSRPRVIDTSACYIPDEYQQLVRLYSRGGTFNTPVLFMHRLKTPAGGERLVTVRDFYFNSGGSKSIMLLPAVQSLTRWTGAAAAHVDSRGAANLTDLEITDILRFYAGQPDPADPTRFTIRFELNGQPGTITGRLDDKNQVNFTIENWPRTFRPAG